MICDAKIEIICDGLNCNDNIEYEMPFVYDDYTGNNGHYSSNDADIESFLVDNGWIVSGDKYFCCEDCKDSIIF